MFFVPFLLAASLSAASLDTDALAKDLTQITSKFEGRVGVCVEAHGKPVCLNRDQRFSLQSVMKMLVGMAVLDAVDHNGWKLDDKVLVHRKDLSLFMQPIAEKVGPSGFETTIGDLIRRANVDSDSAAADILADRLGGISAVQRFLNRSGIRGMRIDRTERDLQTEINGLKWRPEFVEAEVLRSAIAALPRDQKAAAYARYQKDVRDTSTPLAMVELLRKLSSGKLLSPSSTRFMLEVLEQVNTGQDRLKAGTSKPWRLAHKTGTSGSFEGLTVASNDVGLFRGPSGDIAVSVFVADSHAADDTRAKVIADIARAILRHARP
jgi:beta-lactamase class A